MTMRGMLFGAVALVAAAVGVPQVGSAAILTPGSGSLGTINLGSTVQGTGVLWGTKLLGGTISSDTSDTFSAAAGAGVTGYEVTLTKAEINVNTPLPGILDDVINLLLNSGNGFNTGNYQVNSTSVSLGVVSSLAAVANLTVSADIPLNTTLGTGAGAIYYLLTVKGVNTVPLPAAGIFLASALGGLGVMRRRAKRVATA